MDNRIIKISINIPRILINEIEFIVNKKNSIYLNRTEFIKNAIIEKIQKEKKSD